MSRLKIEAYGHRIYINDKLIIEDESLKEEIADLERLIYVRDLIKEKGLSLRKLSTFLEGEN